MNDTFVTDPLPPIPTSLLPLGTAPGSTGIHAAQPSILSHTAHHAGHKAQACGWAPALHLQVREPLGPGILWKDPTRFSTETKQGPWRFKPALPYPAAHPTHPDKERQYPRFVMFHPSHSTASGCSGLDLLAGCLSCPASITFPVSLALGDLFCFHVNNVRKVASWQWALWVRFTCFLQYKLILSGTRKQLYLFVCFFCLLVCPDKRWPNPIGWVGGVGSLSVESQPKFLRICFLRLPMPLKCFPMRPWAAHWFTGVWENGSMPFWQVSSLEDSGSSRSCEVLLALAPPPGDTLVTFLLLPLFFSPVFWIQCISETLQACPVDSGSSWLQFTPVFVLFLLESSLTF